MHSASQEVCLTCNTYRDDAANATVCETLAANPDDIPEPNRAIIEAAATLFDPSLIEPPF